MEETVHIERMSYGPSAIARSESGKTAFVDGAVAGDVARIRIVEEKPNMMRAEAVEIVEPSPYRTRSVPCSICDRCGGCPWAHLDYQAQIRFKRDNLVDALVRVAHMESERVQQIVQPCVPCKRQWGYRNKIELAAFTENGKLSLGFHREGTHEMIPIKSCPLANKHIQNAPKAVTGALRYLSSRQDLGIFRVGIRSSIRTNQTEIALWTEASQFPRSVVAKTLQDALKTTSIVRVISKPGKKRSVSKVETLFGKGLWIEKMGFSFPDPQDLADARAADEGFAEEVTYAVSAPSFFQVNTAQAERLVHLVCGALASDAQSADAGAAVDAIADAGRIDCDEDAWDMGGMPLAGMRIADLYCGVGTFSIPLALAGADVVAVEQAGSSARNLRGNADNAQVGIEFMCDDAERAIRGLGNLDAIVVDPPRAGLAKDVIDSIAQIGPESLIYVSCDPQTFARDAARLESKGYGLASATPVDMFPQTFHAETVGFFNKK